MIVENEHIKILCMIGHIQIVKKMDLEQEYILTMCLVKMIIRFLNMYGLPLEVADIIYMRAHIAGSLDDNIVITINNQNKNNEYKFYFNDYGMYDENENKYSKENVKNVISNINSHFKYTQNKILERN